MLYKRTITPRVIVGEWVKIHVNNKSRNKKDKNVLMQCSRKLLVSCSSAILSLISSNWMLFGPLETIIVNKLRPRQNVRQFADGIFKCIFFNENAWIPINISLKFVPRGPINNIPALVRIMAWRRSGDRPLFGPMMVRWFDYRRIYASLDLNELIPECHLGLWKHPSVILVNPKYLSALLYFIPNIQENANEYRKKCLHDYWDM